MIYIFILTHKEAMTEIFLILATMDLSFEKYKQREIAICQTGRDIAYI